MMRVLNRVFATGRSETRSTVREMTDGERQAFDAAFAKMGEAVKALDVAFGKIES